MPVAQFNVARARWDLDDPRMSEFMTTVPKMNELAEKQTGYIWRHLNEAEMKQALFPDDPRLTMTLSLWRDFDALYHFVWNTIHKRFRLRKGEWFESYGAPYLVVWEVPKAHIPTPQEAKSELVLLTEHGPTETRYGTEKFMHESLNS